MSEARQVVVGGGPAAAAAAVALSNGGARVLVVEPGIRLDEGREATRRRLAATAPEHWSAEDLALFSYEMHPDSGLGQKRLFGSDFPYANPGAPAPRSQGVGAQPSFAAGGLSTVWGAGLLSYTEGDLDRWPLSIADLAPHYAAVAALLPLAAERDGLAERFPLHKEPDGVLLRSAEGERILERLGGDRRLVARGWHLGAARLAVRAGRPAPTNGCVYCGHCLDGCPYGHIYSAAQTLDALSASGAIEYRGGETVERVVEEAGSVRLELRAVGSGARSELRAERAYLGAGALATTLILQRSGILPAQVELLDSQTIYLPLLWIGAPAARRTDDRYALAQAFALLESPAVSARSVHLSLYGYSADFPERLRELRPALARLLGPLLERATRQLVFAICFLHSDDSRRFTSTLDGERWTLSARGSGVPEVVGRLKRTLVRDLVPRGMIPLTAAAEIAPPGGGYHFGGSVPMRAAPGAGESDLLGRPAGSERLHVIDGACFPSIPGGPITLTIMANAHRIASAAAASQ